MWVIQVKKPVEGERGIGRNDQHSRSYPMSHRLVIPCWLPAATCCIHFLGRARPFNPLSPFLPLCNWEISLLNPVKFINICGWNLKFLVPSTRSQWHFQWYRPECRDNSLSRKPFTSGLYVASRIFVEAELEWKKRDAVVIRNRRVPSSEKISLRIGRTIYGKAAFSSGFSRDESCHEFQCIDFLTHSEIASSEKLSIDRQFPAHSASRISNIFFFLMSPRFLYVFEAK